MPKGRKHKGTSRQRRRDLAHANKVNIITQNDIEDDDETFADKAAEDINSKRAAALTQKAEHDFMLSSFSAVPQKNAADLIRKMYKSHGQVLKTNKKLHKMLQSMIKGDFPLGVTYGQLTHIWLPKEYYLKSDFQSEFMRTSLCEFVSQPLLMSPKFAPMFSSFLGFISCIRDELSMGSRTDTIWCGGCCRSMNMYLTQKDFTTGLVIARTLPKTYAKMVEYNRSISTGIGHHLINLVRGPIASNSGYYIDIRNYHWFSKQTPQVHYLKSVEEMWPAQNTLNWYNYAFKDDPTYQRFANAMSGLLALSRFKYYPDSYYEELWSIVAEHPDELPYSRKRFERFLSRAPLTEEMPQKEAVFIASSEAFLTPTPIKLKVEPILAPSSSQSWSDFPEVEVTKD